MTRDDIIKLAREADPGFDGGPDADGTMLDSIVGIAAVERFAALVAAAEREACARVAEDWDIDSADPRDVAAAIRARGNQ